MTEETIIGFLAAFFTTVAFLPQAIKVLKTKSAQDISLLMYLIFCTGALLWLIYGFLIHSYPLIVANAITFFFAGMTLFLKIKYNRLTNSTTSEQT